jgi:hypothetical protein
MKYHEYANLFPMMTEPDLMRLAEDIKEKGMLDPVITLDGKILDGRNRFKACGINGITPRFEEYSGDDPLGYVVSHNLHRRHLSESQRAMVAAEWAGLKQGGDRGNQHTGGKSPIGGLANQSATATRNEAAKLLNVGTSSIDRAKKVKKEAPELAEKVKSGDMSVNAAYVTTKNSTADLETLVVDGTSKEAPVTSGTTPEKRPPNYKPSDGMGIYLVAKSHMEKIHKSDTQRKDALKAMIKFCESKL